MSNIQTQIQTLIDTHKVMLFMKGNKEFPQCGFSDAVVKILKQEGVAFETCNVLTDPELRQGIKDFSNWPTIPQLYIDGQFVGGCEIVTTMHQNGELDQTLRAAGMK